MRPVLKRLVPAPLWRALKHTRNATRALWQRRVDPGFGRRLAAWADREGRPDISVVMVTFDRLRMLREGLESLLEHSSDRLLEVVVWDNASTDGTGEYLDELASRTPRLRVVHNRVNIGLNGVAEAVKLTRGFHVINVDDDVLSFPRDWDARMAQVFDGVPRAGYLAANVVQNEKTNGSKPGSDHYAVRDFGGGAVIEEGPAGGWCSITSLEVLSAIGNFPRRPGTVFFLFDGDYAGRCLESGRLTGVIPDVVVYHAAGPLLNAEYGYLRLCEEKYEGCPEFADSLEETRRVAAGLEPPR